MLFLLTLAATVQAGATWAGRVLVYEEMGLYAFWLDGLRFAVSLLLFLSVHEFGHYFAARHHGVDTSLPYFIPAPFVGIGTFGAVIRIREPIPSLRKLFDIGAAGPLAGFVVALGVLLVAMATLPGPEYIFGLDGHQALKAYIRRYGTFPPEMLPADPGTEGLRLVVGQTPLFWLLSQFFPNVPPMYELYHYPVLFAGWLGLFFTALNLLPIGQLDGGHILYALVGPRWHKRLAHGFFMVLLVSGSIGFMNSGDALLEPMHAWGGAVVPWLILSAILYVYLNRVFEGDLRIIVPVLFAMMTLVALSQWVGEPLQRFGYSGWLLFALLLAFLVRVEHPPVLYHEPLTPTRRFLGYLCILIFILCFSLRPLYFV
ncbi:MAG: peptidase M50 [Rhodothermaceae bacterium]|nr:MAG: site-2 protease family protein [Bacteroidota bacterium]GIV61310.1 MAG: peptidase M50 [Rhodothermaceae bacterium]